MLAARHFSNQFAPMACSSMLTRPAGEGQQSPQGRQCRCMQHGWSGRLGHWVSSAGLYAPWHYCYSREFLFQNPSLEHLDLSCNELNEAGGKVCRRRPCTLSLPQAIHASLKGNQVLRSMDMRLTKFGKVGCSAACLSL
jgi:hypothetical protein